MPGDADSPTPESAWATARERLRASVPPSTFDLWLDPLQPCGGRGETLLLTAPATTRTWVERRYALLIEEALRGSPGHFSAVAFVAPDGAGPDGAPGPDPVAVLNPSYTFERFVIGEGNRVAHAAALAVAEAPAEAYNPLFLHGPPGLGKTHLLVAIAHYLSVHAPELSVRYTTAESFTNEFVTALRNSGSEAFKARYRDLDVLLVDDVQFLQGKHHTEEEFFHTFNALYEGGSQLILSADRIPSELSTLAARLRDRFEWGLTIAIEPPDLPTRMVVLRRLADEAGVAEPDRDALSELAHRIDSNVRRLHGALTRVIAHTSLTARPLSAELIAELIPRSSSTPSSTAEEIQTVVAEEFGISRAELVGPGRAGVPLRARQVAMLLTRELTELSLPEIGRLYGDRDHSTVLNALRRVQAGIAEDAELAGRVAGLRTSIHSHPRPAP